MDEKNGGSSNQDSRSSKSKSCKEAKKATLSPPTEATEHKKPNQQQRTTYVPDTNLPLACLVCLCFNFPLGVVAMYLSLSAARFYRDGNVVKGEKRAKLSVLLSLFSIVTTVLIVTAIVVWIVVDKQNKRALKELKT
jgi:hypothetical protein